MIRLFLTALLLCAVSSCGMNPAFAGQRHKTYLAHPDCNGTGPNAMTCIGVAPSPRGQAIADKMKFGSAQKVYTPRVSRNQNTKHDVFFSQSYSGIARPVHFIAGRLICAINVGAALAERGIKGTGSALALSYLHWGRSAGGPVPGAVIVSARRGGGHVALVSRVVNGVVYAWNATGGQRDWREIPYRHRVLDYRVPG